MIPQARAKAGANPVNPTRVDLTPYKQAMNTIGKGFIDRENNRKERRFASTMRDKSKEQMQHIREVGITDESLEAYKTSINDTADLMVEEFGISDGAVVQRLRDAQEQTVEATSTILQREYIQQQNDKDGYEVKLAINQGEPAEEVGQISVDHVQSLKEQYEQGLIDQDTYFRGRDAMQTTALFGNFENFLKDTLPPMGSEPKDVEAWINQLEGMSTNEELKQAWGGAGNEDLSKLMKPYISEAHNRLKTVSLMDGFTGDRNVDKQRVQDLNRQYGNDPNYKQALAEVNNWDTEQEKNYNAGTMGNTITGEHPIHNFNSHEVLPYLDAVIAASGYGDAVDFAQSTVNDTQQQQQYSLTFADNSNLYYQLRGYMESFSADPATGRVSAKSISDAINKLVSGEAGIFGGKGDLAMMNEMKKHPLFETTLENTLMELAPDLSHADRYMLTYGGDSEFDNILPTEQEKQINKADWESEHNKSLDDEIDSVINGAGLPAMINALGKTDPSGKNISDKLAAGYRDTIGYMITKNQGSKYAEHLADTIQKNNPVAIMADGRHMHLDSKHDNIKYPDATLRTAIGGRAAGGTFYMFEDGKLRQMKQPANISGSYDRDAGTWNLHHAQDSNSTILETINGELVPATADISSYNNINMAEQSYARDKVSFEVNEDYGTASYGATQTDVRTATNIGGYNMPAIQSLMEKGYIETPTGSTPAETASKQIDNFLETGYTFKEYNEQLTHLSDVDTKIFQSQEAMERVAGMSNPSQEDVEYHNKKLEEMQKLEDERNELAIKLKLLSD